MLLKGAGIIYYSEFHTFRGRSDLLIQFRELIIVLEFKFTQKSSQLDDVMNVGILQVNNREYAKSYASDGRKLSRISSR